MTWINNIPITLLIPLNTASWTCTVLGIGNINCDVSIITPSTNPNRNANNKFFQKLLSYRHTNTPSGVIITRLMITSFHCQLSNHHICLSHHLPPKSNSILTVLPTETLPRVSSNIVITNHTSTHQDTILHALVLEKNIFITTGNTTPTPAIIPKNKYIEISKKLFSFSTRCFSVILPPYRNFFQRFLPHRYYFNKKSYSCIHYYKKTEKYLMHETIYIAGNIVMSNTYTCARCGLKVYVRHHHPLPLCPRCGYYEYTLDIDYR